MPGDGDIVVVAQKAVSKAQGRYVDLATIKPSWHARELAVEVDKDPRLVEVILSESVRVVRQRPGVLIVEHRSGYIMANAGVDRSNVAPAAGEEPVLLLPIDADAAAETLRSTSAGISPSGSASSSATASAGPGAAARSASRSAPPACRRSRTCAASPTCTGGRCGSPRPASPTRSPRPPRC